MRFADADKFFQSFLEAFPIDKFPWTTTYCADANDTVIRNTIETISPRLGRSPTYVIDYCESVFAEPVSERPHPISIIDFDRFGEILISRKVRSDNSRKMA
jgi:hypothetical protein